MPADESKPFRERAQQARNLGLPPTASVGQKVQAMKDAHAARKGRHPETGQFRRVNGGRKSQ